MQQAGLRPQQARITLGAKSRATIAEHDDDDPRQQVPFALSRAPCTAQRCTLSTPRTRSRNACLQTRAVLLAGLAPGTQRCKPPSGRQPSPRPCRRPPRRAARVIDAVEHQQKRPPLSDDAVVSSYIELMGGAPTRYALWLGLETKNVAYETVLIDNTGGARPRAGSARTTPRIRWADGTDQGELN